MTGLLKLRVALSILLSTFLLSCGPSPTRTITVTVNGNSLTVNGGGFSNVPQCAQLTLYVASPSFNALNESGFFPMGLANCSGGIFENFSWSFSYTTIPGSSQSCQLQSDGISALVIALDQASTPEYQSATQQIFIP
jgi:hypothetical protein